MDRVTNASSQQPLLPVAVFHDKAGHDYHQHQEFSIGPRGGMPKIASLIIRPAIFGDHHHPLFVIDLVISPVSFTQASCVTHSFSG